MNNAEHMHLFVDADSIAYAAAYKEDPVAIMVHIDEVMKSIWRDACKIADQQGRPLHRSWNAWVESWGEKWNFRKFVAVTQKYKGKRVKTIPPRLIENAKKHLVSNYGAGVAIYCESEDHCLIGANAVGFSNAIVACIDKDLYQVPGVTFLNYNTGEISSYTQEQAHYNLWRQIALGDSTDGIAGVPGIGKSAKFFSEVLDKANPECYSRLVAGLYKDCSKWTTAQYPDGHSYEYFMEQCRLIYLLREPAEVWTPLTKEEWNEL